MGKEKVTTLNINFPANLDYEGLKMLLIGTTGQIRLINFVVGPFFYYKANKIKTITRLITMRSQPNLTTIEVGLDMKMTLHHHHPPPPPTNTN